MMLIKMHVIYRYVWSFVAVFGCMIDSFNGINTAFEILTILIKVIEIYFGKSLQSIFESIF